METMLTYNTNSNTGPVCGGRASFNRIQLWESLIDDTADVVQW